MSIAKKTNKNAKFKSYEEALSGLSRLGNNFLSSSMLIKYNHDIFSLFSSKEGSDKLVKELTVWTQRCSDLKTPWPDKYIKKLINLNTNGERFSDVLVWCKMPFNKSRPIFEKLLEFGVNPCQYIESGKVSLLGFSSYAFLPQAFNFLLEKSPVPDSRLLLLKKHLSHPNSFANRNVVNSTLLHRLMTRFSHDSGKRIHILKKMVQSIIKHDPECVLQKTLAGSYPENLCFNDDIKNILQQARLTYTAQKDKEAIYAQIDKDKINMGSESKRPKI